MATHRHLLILALVLVPFAAFQAPAAHAATTWGDYARNPQHTAISTVASQSLAQIVWQTPVDLDPQYVGDDLLIHYGSPLVGPSNTILVPVKVGAADTFRIEAHNGGTGALLWQFTSDYTLPAHDWTPSYGPTLTPQGTLYMAGAGGTVFVTSQVDQTGPHTPARLAFYGLSNWNASPVNYNSDIQICTPLTSDAAGNVYFMFRAGGANPLGITGGIARIGADGSGAWVTSDAASGNTSTTPLMNCAPALSNDGSTVYVVVRQTSTSKGYLVALSSTTLATQHVVTLIDPKSGLAASCNNDGTASPMVAPDGHVYFGVLENPFGDNADRGWLLHFDASLSPAGVPGEFGWDDTPSLVPASAVPGYHGSSSYLLMTKYNFYADTGGDGVNRIAVLDPFATPQMDNYTSAAVMQEVLTIAGVTPDSEFLGSFPNAVREWCINSAVVDTFTRSVLAGSEDGRLYRWDLTSNTFTESITLTQGIGEAYTPTLIAQDGRVYAINDATLFAVGLPFTGVSAPGPSAAIEFAFAPAQPNPASGSSRFRFTLPAAGRVQLDVFDPGGRRIATLLDGELPAGERHATWGGRDDQGRPAAAGLYFARLTWGGRTLTRRLVRVP